MRVLRERGAPPALARLAAGGAIALAVSILGFAIPDVWRLRAPAVPG